MKAHLMGILMIASVATAGDATIEFTGILAAGDTVRVALRDSASGTSSWLKIGDSFSGYRVSAFEAATETVVLVRDGVTSRIRLSDAKPNTAPFLAPATASAILNHLRQISAAADQYFLETGASSTTLAELVGETKYVRRLIPVAGEDYSGLQLTQGTAVFSVRTPEGAEVSYNRYPNRPATHVVQAGETLGQIGRQAGLSVRELATLNNVTDPATLRPGQVLRLK